jgi:hypothetical protein
MRDLNDPQSSSQYIHWCAAMANKQNVGVPWIMCQQDDDVPPSVVSSFHLFRTHQLENRGRVTLSCRIFLSSHQDQHLQRVLLPRLVPQPDRHPQDVDRKLDWLVIFIFVYPFFQLFILQYSDFHLDLSFRFKAWDKPDFHRPAKDIAFAVAMFFQKRGSLQNYYMVHTDLSSWQWVNLFC